MQQIKTTDLTDTQIRDIHRLETACQIHDSISLTFPIEENTVYFLLYDEDVLLSALSAFFNGEDAWECSAFTLPEYRNRGCFTRLMDSFLDDAGEYDVIFTVDEKCIDTGKTLKALEAELWYHEYLMEFLLPAGITVPKPGKESRLSYFPGLETVFPAGDMEFQIMEGSLPVGNFHLSVHGDRVYFYGFEIKEEFRRQGLGSAALTLLLNDLTQLHETIVKSVYLQVSGNNEPAVALYKKTGFQITETISYYLY